MTAAVTSSNIVLETHESGIKPYFEQKIQETELKIRSKTENVRRLEAQRNALNDKVRFIKDELRLLQEPGSYVGEVIKIVSDKKVLVKVQPEGKYIVDVAKDINVKDLKASQRVCLRSDSYMLHKVLENKADPLVSLMMVEKVPDSTYDMVGGLTKQIKEIKEVLRNQRVSSYMAPLVQGKPYWQELSHITLIVNSSGSVVRNWYKSISAKVPVWSVSCL